MIVEPPEKQCPTVQKLGLNVRKLEEVTMEAMSNWFNDKEHPENAQKRPFLKEIFKIAKAEERYKNGEIGKLISPSNSQNSKLTVDRCDYRDSCDVRRKVWQWRWRRV
jgi:hypothetical protein